MNKELTELSTIAGIKMVYQQSTLLLNDLRLVSFPKKFPIERYSSSGGAYEPKAYL